MVLKMIKPLIQIVDFMVSDNEEWLWIARLKSEIHINGFDQNDEWFGMDYVEREQDIIFWLNEI